MDICVSKQPWPRSCETMALLQSCLLQGASPFVVALRAEGSVRKTSSVQVDVKPACSSLICRASAGSNGNGHVLPQEDCSPSPLMFKDESNGIVCYYNENGELMCEGYDEGPHFQPEAPKYFTRRWRMSPRAMQRRGTGDAVRFKSHAGRMTETLREGVADESLNCSEL